MPSAPAVPTVSPPPAAALSRGVAVALALQGFAAECRAVALRVLAYAAGLAVLAGLVLGLVGELPAPAPAAAAAPPGWIPIARPYPAFAVSQPDFPDPVGSYAIFRHPQGGRRDVLRWTAAHGRPAAEIEIYRPGEEAEAAAAPEAGLMARMALPGAGWEAAGVLDTKFGPMALIRPVDAPAERAACLAFAATFEAPRLLLSGFSCQAATVAAQRARLACALDRLLLLSAGNDPKVAELFARAELRRTGCAARPQAASWLDSAAEPPLRGRL